MHARLATRLALLAMILPGRVATAQAPGGPRGDPSAGRALFVGARAFQAGGPPCGACHGISGEGLGVAASYGPDLSGASAAYGDDALVTMLDDLPFPSMAPVYAGRPLTAAELELMNLTGDGNGFDMVTMPQVLREKVPTANFFQQSGYERNPVARRTATVAGLIAHMQRLMTRGAQAPGARELASVY